jgi:inorganic triphosphatase YgiF
MVLDFQVVINVDVQEVATFCGHQGPGDILQKLRRFRSRVLVFGKIGPDLHEALLRELINFGY